MRFRSDKRWNTQFVNYDSPEAFTEQSVASGTHTIQWRDQPLDLLVVDRGSETTLVTFNGAVPLRIQSYPLFTGLGLAEDTSVNLVAVSDPSLLAGELTVAWYLGNRETGPISETYAKLIQHALASLNTKRAILFGVSGGGYAAARMGDLLEDSVTLLVNPRLSLLEYSAAPLGLYFRHSLGREIASPISTEDIAALEEFGPVRYRLDRNTTLNHDLLIYQNVVDFKFMSTQVLPFLESVDDDPRLHIRFEADEVGHTPIPSETIREIISNISSGDSQGQAIRTAGFANREEAAFRALHKFQPLAARLKNLDQKLQMAVKVNEPEAKPV